MTKAAIYARKSTDQSGVAEDARSVTRQEENARAYIAKRGWTLDEAHVYVDDNVSGARFLTRPRFQDMLRDAEAGAFSELVMFDLDRFGRNSRRTMEALYALADLGVKVWDYATGKDVDLASFEGRLTVNLRAEFAHEEREKTRRRTAEALQYRAEHGCVTGCAVYGYTTVREGEKGLVRRQIDPEQRTVLLKYLFVPFAHGASYRRIAAALNVAGVPAPREGKAHRSSPGWSSTPIRAIIKSVIYRGVITYGRTRVKDWHELTAAERSGRKRERKVQVRQPEEEWTRVPAPELRILDPELQERVDARLREMKERHDASRGTGRAPQKASGTYLLSGGALLCPTCGGHFEARGRSGSYLCATRRRKRSCTNTLRLPIRETDEAVLDILEGEVLGTRYVEELLTLVETGEADPTLHLTAERDRLRDEKDRLVEAIARGHIASEDAGRQIDDLKARIARLDAQLREPRPGPPDREKLRAALEQRTTEWRAALRDEPEVARLLLRRLVGPLTLHAEPAPPWVEEARRLPGPLDPSSGPEREVRWEAETRPERMLEGIYPVNKYRTPLSKVVVGELRTV